MSCTMSALRAREGGLAPRAWAMVVSSSRSFRSRADRSRVFCSALIRGCHLTAFKGETCGRPGPLATHQWDVLADGSNFGRTFRFRRTSGAARSSALMQRYPPAEHPYSSATPLWAETPRGVRLFPLSASKQAGQHLVARDRLAAGRGRLAVDPARPVHLAVDQQVGHRVGG